MGLESLIKEYKEISLKILNDLDNDNLDFLNELLDERGKIIKNIDMIEPITEEMRKIYVKYGVFDLDKLIAEKIEFRKNELRKKLLNIKKRREGTKSYNNLNTKAVFLSKEI